MAGVNIVQASAPKIHFFSAAVMCKIIILFLSMCFSLVPLVFDLCCPFLESCRSLLLQKRKTLLRASVSKDKSAEFITHASGC